MFRILSLLLILGVSKSMALVIKPPQPVPAARVPKPAFVLPPDFARRAAIAALIGTMSLPMAEPVWAASTYHPVDCVGSVVLARSQKEQDERADCWIDVDQTITKSQLRDMVDKKFDQVQRVNWICFAIIFVRPFMTVEDFNYWLNKVKGWLGRIEH
jgi:hypothetical protein